MSRKTPVTGAASVEYLRTAIIALDTLRLADHAPMGGDAVDVDLHSLQVTGGDSRRERPAQDETVRRELCAIARQATELDETLKSIHGRTMGAFANLEGARRTIQILAIIANHATQALPPASAEFNGLTPAQLLALRAAQVFLRRTGKRPGIINKEGQKACGSFLEFLTKVFEARGMRASVENSAKAALAILRTMENTAPKNSP